MGDLPPLLRPGRGRGNRHPPAAGPIPPPQAELDAWALDQHINDRGVRLDPVLVEKALELDAVYTGRLLAEAKAVTGLENPNSGAQLSRWLETKGLQVTSLDKKAVPELLAAAPDDSTRAGRSSFARSLPRPP